tara:strand:+ start:209 stop:1594 length:1386 start_codon:yes stop_codon:yes gene_type:complete
MATFEEQVEALTSLAIDSGSAPTQTELTQFLTDGAKEIINKMPRSLLELCSAEQTFTSGTAATLNTGKILNVFRSDGDIKQPCRAIPSSLKGKASDAEEMTYATTTDPVYYIDNNTIDVLPNGGSCFYSEVQYPAVAYGSDAISVFPDEAEYLVVLYGAIKSLQNVLGSQSSSLNNNDGISDAFTACHTEIDKLANEIIIPVPPVIQSVEYTHPSSFTSASSSSVSPITVDKVDKADISVHVPTYTAPTIGDQTEELTAAMHADSSGYGTDADFTDFSKWFSVVGEFIEDEEDIDLARVQISKIQTYIAAYQSALQNQLYTFNKENEKYKANIQAELAKHNSDIQANISQANINARDAQQEAAQATDVSKFTASQHQAQILTEAAKTMDAIVGDNSNKMQKHSNEVQAYQANVSKIVQNAQAYLAEIQSRLAVDTTKYTWYEKQQAKLQADYDKGLQALGG